MCASANSPGRASSRERGDFHWDWLDRAFDVARRGGAQSRAGHADRDAAEMADGRASRHRAGRRSKGGRAASARAGTTRSPPPVYGRESARIVEALAQALRRARRARRLADRQRIRLPRAPYCPGDAHDLAAFRDWLRRRYQSPERLNDAWGTVFWSMEVASFDEVALPNLDRHRNQSRRAARFPALRLRAGRAPTTACRPTSSARHSPGRWVTHNFMGFFTRLRPFRAAPSIWISRRGIPTRSASPSAFRSATPSAPLWQDTAHPDIAPVPSRSLSRRRARPLLGDGAAAGPGELGAVQPDPGAGHGQALGARSACARRRGRLLFPLAPGALRAGADARRAQSARHSERSVAGRTRGGRGRRAISQRSAICRRAAARRSRWSSTTRPSWVCEIQPQGASFNYLELVFRWYEAVRRLGLDVDILRPGDSLDGYALVLAPTLPIVSEAAEAAFAGGRRRRCFRAAQRLQDPPVRHSRGPAAGAAALARSRSA